MKAILRSLVSRMGHWYVHRAWQARERSHVWVHQLGRYYVQEMCFQEYEDQTFKGLNERPVEYGFALRQVAVRTPTSVLDVGTGTTAFPHLLRTCGAMVTAIDNVRDYWDEGVCNRHFHVLDEDICNPHLEQKYDLITCLSVLEHIPDHQGAMRSMFSLLNPGGAIVVTCPYKEVGYVQNVYSLAGAGYGQNSRYVCQVYSRAELDCWLRENDVQVGAQEYWRIFSGDLWSFGERLQPAVQVDRDQLHHLTCVVLQKR